VEERATSLVLLNVVLASDESRYPPGMIPLQPKELVLYSSLNLVKRLD
jgi:hypothetical protein